MSPEKTAFLNLVETLKRSKTSYAEIERRIEKKKGFLTTLIHSGRGRVTQELINKLKKAFPELDKSNNYLNTKEEFDEKETEYLKKIYELQKKVDEKEALNNRLQQEIEQLKKDMNKS